MDLTQQPTFLLAMQEVLKIDVAATALTIDELFFMANGICPTDERIRYGAYLRFMDSLDKYGEPTVPHLKADLLLEIHDCIKAEQARQRAMMLEKILKGEKDWRRFVWLLQWQEKQERQQNAQAKQLAKEQKERKLAAEAAAKLAETEPTEEPAVSCEASNPALAENTAPTISNAAPQQPAGKSYQERRRRNLSRMN